MWLLSSLGNVTWTRDFRSSISSSWGKVISSYLEGGVGTGSYSTHGTGFIAEGVCMCACVGVCALTFCEWTCTVNMLPSVREQWLMIVIDFCFLVFRWWEWDSNWRGGRDSSAWTAETGSTSGSAWETKRKTRHWHWFRHWGEDPIHHT